MADIGQREREIGEGLQRAAEDGDQGNALAERMDRGEKEHGGQAGDSRAGDRGKRQREEEQLYEGQDGRKVAERGTDSGRLKRRRTREVRYREE